MDFGNIVSVSLLSPTFTWLVLCWVQVWRCQGCRGGLLGAGHSWFQQTHGADAARGTAHAGLFGGLVFQCQVGLWPVPCDLPVRRKLPCFRRTILVMLLRGQSGFHPLAISRSWSFLPHQLFPLHVLAEFSANENPLGDFIQLWDNLANSNLRCTESLNCLVY